MCQTVPDRILHYLVRIMLYVQRQSQKKFCKELKNWSELNGRELFLDVLEIDGWHKFTWGENHKPLTELSLIMWLGFIAEDGFGNIQMKQWVWFW